MSGIQVTVSLRTILRLMVAAQACQNAPVPSVQNSSSAGTTEAPILPSGYVAFPEYGLAYKYFEFMVSYNDAISRCSREKGQLAVIDSIEKVEKINNEFGQELWPWVGVHHSHDTEGWTTIDGNSIDDLPWASGEPTVSGRCARLSSRYNGLANFPCSNKYTYLCEIAWPRN